MRRGRLATSRLSLGGRRTQACQAPIDPVWAACQDGQGADKRSCSSEAEAAGPRADLDAEAGEPPETGDSQVLLYRDIRAVRRQLARDKAQQHIKEPRFVALLSLNSCRLQKAREGFDE